MFDFCVVAMARCHCCHFAVAVPHCTVLGSILDTDVRLKHAPAPDIPRTLTTHPARRRQGEARPAPAQNWPVTASLTYPSKQTRPQSRPCEARHETLTLPIGIMRKPRRRPSPGKSPDHWYVHLVSTKRDESLPKCLANVDMIRP